jgi:hypothetical protein
MKTTLLALLAVLAASAVPAPAMASGNSNAAWWFLGGALFGHFVTGAQRVYSYPLTPARVGMVYCPPGTVHYDQYTNICYTQVLVQQPVGPIVSVPQAPRIMPPAPQLSAAEVAAQAYQSLGPAPDGRKVANHSVRSSQGHTCKDGTAALLVKQSRTPGFQNYRYFCPND